MCTDVYIYKWHRVPRLAAIFQLQLVYIFYQLIIVTSFSFYLCLSLFYYLCMFYYYPYNSFISLSVPYFFTFFYKICVWPQAGRSRAISSNNSPTIIVKVFTKSVCGPRWFDLEQFRPTTANNYFQDFYKVFVWSQAGRSRAIHKKQQKHYF